jgi:hypothetical protein
MLIVLGHGLRKTGSRSICYQRSYDHQVYIAAGYRGVDLKHRQWAQRGCDLAG